MGGGGTLKIGLFLDFDAIFHRNYFFILIVVW